jgi:hypothetical protein
MDTPVKTYEKGAEGANFTPTTPHGKQDALTAGYLLIRVEGDVYNIRGGQSITSRQDVHPMFAITMVTS